MKKSIMLSRLRAYHETCERIIHIYETTINLASFFMTVIIFIKPAYLLWKPLAYHMTGSWKLFFAKNNIDIKIERIARLREELPIKPKKSVCNMGQLPLNIITLKCATEMWQHVKYNVAICDINVETYCMLHMTYVASHTYPKAGSGTSRAPFKLQPL